MDLIIIDDDKFMSKVFDSLLKDTGLEYEFFTEPHQGLDAIIKNRPSCVVLDYTMPNLKGDELIIKSSQELLFKYCNFILVSGESFDEMGKMKLMTLGFQHIFHKQDIKGERFIETIKELVEDKKKIA